MLHCYKLYHQNQPHHSHLQREHPIVASLILFNTPLHPIVLLQNLLELPSCLPNINKELAYFLRQFVNVLLPRRYHFFLFIHNVEMNCGISGTFLLKTNRVKSSLRELDLEERFVVYVRPSLVHYSGLLVVNDHIDFINVGVHVITEEHGILGLIDLELKTGHITFDDYLHRGNEAKQGRYNY
jgi:hypothetical protein